MLCGAILAWARAIGEFGATLMLAGATRFKTETLPVAVYLNISSGDFEIAIGQPYGFNNFSLFAFLLRVLNRGTLGCYRFNIYRLVFLKDISLTVANGESVAIVGQSGSGKTTLLNAIAGYSDYQGSIAFNQCAWDNLASWERRCRYLNPTFISFPHKTVGKLKV